MKYINPVNNYERDISVPFIWSLLFGPFYMFWHGANIYDLDGNREGYY